MRQECAICSGDLEHVWSLPGLPLTGIFVEAPDSPVSDYFHDQALLFCSSCKHGQLGIQVAPELLYRETYSHRTSGSTISRAGNDFLIQRLRSIIANRTVNSVLEIGCNDAYLLQALAAPGRTLHGIDPMWQDRETEIGEIRLSGEFAERVDYDSFLNSKVDLLISSHTFEHLFDPLAVVRHLRGHLADDAIVVIEVPSLERMLDQARLDQVFSQHTHYYSAASMARLMSELDLSLVDVTYNFDYWGGTQLLTFERRAEASAPAFRDLRAGDVARAIEAFEQGMKLAKWQIDSAPGEVVGFGAAQMLPVLLYHLGEQDRLSKILDDNPERQGKYFPHSAVPILPAAAHENWGSTTTVITALDSSRVLLTGAIDRGSRTVILPIGLS